MTSHAADLPHVTAVCLLDAYSSAHGDGNSSLKSSMWKLSKARRQRGNGARISALDVREELQARAVLRESTPELVESEGTTSSNNEQEEDRFVLVDAVEELAEKRAQKENDVPTKKQCAGRSKTPNQKQRFKEYSRMDRRTTSESRRCVEMCRSGRLVWRLSSTRFDCLSEGCQKGSCRIY